MFNLNTIGPCLELSNEVRTIIVAQWAAKLPKVKVGSVRKILTLGPVQAACDGVLDFFVQFMLEFLTNSIKKVQK